MREYGCGRVHFGISIMGKFTLRQCILQDDESAGSVEVWPGEKTVHRTVLNRLVDCELFNYFGYD